MYIDAAIKEKYVPLFFDETKHFLEPFTNNTQRFCILQKVEDNRTQNQSLSSGASVMLKVKDQFPAFHKRQTRSDCNRTRTHNHLVRKRTLKWVLVYKLSGCGFKSRCSHLNFKICACFEQGVPWHSSNYRVWIHSEIRMWHDKNIQPDKIFQRKQSKCCQNNSCSVQFYILQFGT